MALFYCGRLASKSVLATVGRFPTMLGTAQYAQAAAGLPKVSFKKFEPPKQEPYDDKNTRLNRPLSPHLTIYQPQLTSMLSITHRAAGVKETTCLVCRLPCSFMKLVPDMNPEIQDYFTEPEEIIKKSCEVLQFQRQHRRRLLSYLLQSTKKFYTARTELKRMTELCQKQHRQLKEYQKVVKNLESQLTSQSKHVSPFNIPISPGDNLSPSFIQSTPTYKRPAKSTPYNQPYQSNLVTPSRISKQRPSFSAHSQRSNTSNKISSTVFTPPTPPSAGSVLSQVSVESGYFSNSPLHANTSPSVLYCNGFNTKCSLRNFTKNSYI